MQHICKNVPNSSDLYIQVGTTGIQLNDRFIECDFCCFCGEKLPKFSEDTNLPDFSHLEARVLPEHPFYLILENGVVLSNQTNKGLAIYRNKVYGIVNTSINRDGYLMMRLNYKSYSLHTLVARAFLGEKPNPKMIIRHLDDNKLNNHWTNLKYGTKSENYQDFLRNGGVAKNTVVLSKETRLEVLKRLANGEPRQALAKEYGVARSTIRNIAIKGQ